MPKFAKFSLGPLSPQGYLRLSVPLAAFSHCASVGSLNSNPIFPDNHNPPPRSRCHFYKLFWPWFRQFLDNLVFRLILLHLFPGECEGLDQFLQFILLGRIMCIYPLTANLQNFQPLLRGNIPNPEVQSKYYPRRDDRTRCFHLFQWRMK